MDKLIIGIFISMKTYLLYIIKDGKLTILYYTILDIRNNTCMFFLFSFTQVLHAQTDDRNRDRTTSIRTNIGKIAKILDV